MTVSEAERQRPNPMTGQQAGEAYASFYAERHRAADPKNLEYRIWDIDLLAIDSLLNGYTLLDVGCATGGYLRLLKNHALVVGIDFSEETINKARELQAEFGTKRVEFVVSSFEKFAAAGQFDVVRLRGTFGSYQPWPISAQAIERTRGLLVGGGIAVASHYLPMSLLHEAKSILRPKHTLAISTKRFNALWEKRGFVRLFSITLPSFVVVFWRKST